MPRASINNQARKSKALLAEKPGPLERDDVNCPICLSILIQPVTLPCGHCLCCRCFKQHVEKTSLTCPCCRLRIAVWSRHAFKQGNYIDVKLGERIQKEFPELVETALLGADSQDLDPECFISVLDRQKNQSGDDDDDDNDTDENERRFEEIESQRLILQLRQDEDQSQRRGVVNVEREEADLRLALQLQEEQDKKDKTPNVGNKRTISESEPRQRPSKKQKSNNNNSQTGSVAGKIQKSILNYLSPTASYVSESDSCSGSPAKISSSSSCSSKVLFQIGNKPSTIGSFVNFSSSSLSAFSSPAKSTHAQQGTSSNFEPQQQSSSTACQKIISENGLQEMVGDQTRREIASPNSIDLEVNCHFRPIKSAPKTPPRSLPDGSIIEPKVIKTTPVKLRPCAIFGETTPTVTSDSQFDTQRTIDLDTTNDDDDETSSVITCVPLERLQGDEDGDPPDPPTVYRPATAEEREQVLALYESQDSRVAENRSQQFEVVNVEKEDDEEEEYDYEEVEHDPSSLQGNDVIYPETQLNYGQVQQGSSSTLTSSHPIFTHLSNQYFPSLPLQKSAQEEALELQNILQLHEENKKRKRNRVSDPSTWSREIAKKKRMAGEKYVGFTRQLVETTGKLTQVQGIPRTGRVLGPPCFSNHCKASRFRHCDQFNEYHRAQVFNHFWKEMDWNEKKAYVLSLIEVIPTKTSKKKSEDHQTSRRKDTNLYYLHNENDTKLQVCFKMFTSSLGVGSRQLRLWISKNNNNNNKNAQAETEPGTTNQGVSRGRGNGNTAGPSGTSTRSSTITRPQRSTRSTRAAAAAATIKIEDSQQDD